MRADACGTLVLVATSVMTKLPWLNAKGPGVRGVPQVKRVRALSACDSMSNESVGAVGLEKW